MDRVENKRRYSRAYESYGWAIILGHTLVYGVAYQLVR
nr:MAG TPA: hypothetical protein [Bacteriophage sp.]